MVGALVETVVAVTVTQVPTAFVVAKVVTKAAEDPVDCSGSPETVELIEKPAWANYSLAELAETVLGLLVLGRGAFSGESTGTSTAAWFDSSASIVCCCLSMS